VFEGMSISFRSLETITFGKPILGKIKYNKASHVRFGQTDIRYGVQFSEKARAIAVAIELFYMNKNANKDKPKSKSA
jgi:hypothetical protein